MKCWHCERDLDDPSQGKIPFKAICDFCSSYLHCCVNCKNYKPGMPNDCLIPGTEFVLDRTKANYCEDFSLKGTKPNQKLNPNDTAKRLFGDDDIPKKKDFNSLF